MLKHIHILILIFLTSFFASFKYQKAPRSEYLTLNAAEEFLQDSAKYSTIEPDSLEAFLSANIHCLILDVRTIEEFEEKSNPNLGTLKGAYHIPYQELERRAAEIEHYKNKPILIYCARSRRSLIAAEILAKKGFKKIINLNGGIVKINKSHLKK